MSCCGQKRQQWQSSIAKEEPRKATPEPVIENAVTVTYHGSGSYLIKGEQTGLLYLFGSKEPGLLVDSRDLAFLLQDKQRFSLVD